MRLATCPRNASISLGRCRPVCRYAATLRPLRFAVLLRCGPAGTVSLRFLLRSRTGRHVLCRRSPQCCSHLCRRSSHATHPKNSSALLRKRDLGKAWNLGAGVGPVVDGRERLVSGTQNSSSLVSCLLWFPSAVIFGW